MLRITVNKRVLAIVVAVFVLSLGVSAMGLAGKGKPGRHSREAASDGEIKTVSVPKDMGTVTIPDAGRFDLLSTDPLNSIVLEDIKPLYTSPAMPGEGIWESVSSPRDREGTPLVYKTFYRPSIEFPNAIVYMMVIDTSRLLTQYYVGSQEPAANMASSEIDPRIRQRLVVLTNAMWMQKHSRGGGAVFRGNIIYPMVKGMATLIVYKDGSVDIQEWTPDIPLRLVRDARQLRHLLVKNGMVVRSIAKGNQIVDSEIGLGFLLGGGGKDEEGNHFWYVAHRSAFGIRKDGKLVYAIGHHIGTKDLAKALVLAGCERAIHADANPANIVGNLYLRDPSVGKHVRRIRLSPLQRKWTLKRYDDAYTKDYFGFFLTSLAKKKPTKKVTNRGPQRSPRKR
ncbi:hypothetical protein ACFL2Q_15355 [Thermodesulfobacteriota bacterium]